MSDAWSIEAREVPVELIANPHITYPPPPTRFATIAEQLEAADMDTLKLLSGGIGNPEVNGHD